MSASLPKVRAGSWVWDLCRHTGRAPHIEGPTLGLMLSCPTWHFEEQAPCFHSTWDPTVMVLVLPRVTVIHPVGCQPDIQSLPTSASPTQLLLHTHTSFPLFPSITLTLISQRNCIHLLFDSLISSMRARLWFLPYTMPSTTPSTWPVLHKYVLNEWMNSAQALREHSIRNT